MPKAKVIGKLPCPLCKKKLRVTLDKKDMPYISCDSCGMEIITFGNKDVTIKLLQQKGMV